MDQVRPRRSGCLTRKQIKYYVADTGTQDGTETSYSTATSEPKSGNAIDKTSDGGNCNVIHFKTEDVSPVDGNPNVESPTERSNMKRKRPIPERHDARPASDETFTLSTDFKHRGDKSNSKQLYGNPAEGTLVPWGVSRVRKQPKIYPVPQRARGYIEKTDVRLWMADAAIRKTTKQRSSIRRLKPGEEETRLKSFENEMPSWFNTFLQRANTERMFVLERTQDMEENCHAHHHDCPYEALEIAGASGNVYTVTISHLPTCTCPVGLFTPKGHEKLCKHILYVLHHVLKAPEHLQYQRAFLTSELKELFATTPPLPTSAEGVSVKGGNRKEVDGDCPICFMEFGDDQDIVWCKAACGQNLHRDCFDQWAKAKARVTCPMCRSEWQFRDKPPARNLQSSNMYITAEIGPGGYRRAYEHLQPLE